MKRVLAKIPGIIEAFSNFFFSIMVFFMLMLLLSPLIKLLQGRTGLGWILLTILVIGVIGIAVSVGAAPLFKALDKIRKGELFAPFFSVIRNISAIIGIDSVFKLEYLLIHGEEPSTGGSWIKLIWEFITSGF